MMTNHPHPLEVFRVQAGLTREDVASRVGVSPWTVYAIETGRRQPGVKLTLAMESAIGIPKEDLRPDVYRI
jgi:putative transcriptional regulator